MVVEIATPAQRGSLVIPGPPTSVSGIGVTTAAVLLAELPEMGRRETAAPRAALTGVAPYDEERGAMRSKPVIASFAARFTAGGKPVRVRVIACLRKLLTILNTMLTKDEVWTPQRQTP